MERAGAIQAAAVRLLSRNTPVKALGIAVANAAAQPKKHYLRWFWLEVAEEVREEVKRRHGYTLEGIEEKDFPRVANMIAYGATAADVRERLLSEGYTDEEAHFIYHGALMVLEWQEQALPEPIEGLGKLVLANYDPFVPVVARAYIARPVFEEKYLYSWKALARHIDVMFRRLQSKVTIEFTESDPYPDYASMIADIQRGHMLVYTGHSEHPAFSPEQNWRFRAVHDYIAHAGGEHTFSLRGEMAAYNRHVKLAPPDARLALFVEIVAQTSCYFFSGNKFCEQKVCGMFGFDFVNVGRVDEVEYARNFEG